MPPFLRIRLCDVWADFILQNRHETVEATMNFDISLDSPCRRHGFRITMFNLETPALFLYK